MPKFANYPSLDGRPVVISGGTSGIGETLVRSTGQKLRDYARDKLFTPLDITDFEWLDVGVSHRLGAFGSLRLRPRDAAKAAADLGRRLGHEAPDRQGRDAEPDRCMLVQVHLH